MVRPVSPATVPVAPIAAGDVCVAVKIYIAGVDAIASAVYAIATVEPIAAIEAIAPI
jgi:hypothetical protein